MLFFGIKNQIICNDMLDWLKNILDCIENNLEIHCNQFFRHLIRLISIFMKTIASDEIESKLFKTSSSLKNLEMHQNFIKRINLIEQKMKNW